MAKGGGVGKAVAAAMGKRGVNLNKLRTKAGRPIGSYQLRTAIASGRGTWRGIKLTPGRVRAAKKAATKGKGRKTRRGR